MKNQNIIFILIVIPLTILAKTILIKDDPKLDYDFHDEGSGHTKPVPYKTNKTSELEIEENIIDSEQTNKQNVQNVQNVTKPEKPTESVTVGGDPVVPMCSMDKDKFNIKISQLLDKFVPEHLKLRPVVKGAIAKVYLKDGKLIVNKDYKIVGQPYCTQIDDNTKQFEIMLAFNDLMGSYEWKIYNLFGYNFSESALLTVKQIMTEFVIVENSAQRSQLKDIKVGKIEDITVKVNIPEQITSINYLKPMLEYIVSRITTIIANGSKDTIVKNMRDVFLDSIQEKTKINP